MSIESSTIRTAIMDRGRGDRAAPGAFPVRSSQRWQGGPVCGGERGESRAKLLLRQHPASDRMGGVRTVPLHIRIAPGLRIRHSEERTVTRTPLLAAAGLTG